jgi:hypothetical protein
MRKIVLFILITFFLCLPSFPVFGEAENRKAKVDNGFTFDIYFNPLGIPSTRLRLQGDGKHFRYSDIYKEDKILPLRKKEYFQDKEFAVSKETVDEFFSLLKDVNFEKQSKWIGNHEYNRHIIPNAGNMLYQLKTINNGTEKVKEIHGSPVFIYTKSNDTEFAVFLIDLFFYKIRHSNHRIYRNFWE